MCFTEDVIEKCKTLGVTRTMLSLSNLDRMTKAISQNDSFKEIPVIDADQLLWVSQRPSGFYNGKLSFSWQNMFDMRKNYHQNQSMN